LLGYFGLMALLGLLAMRRVKNTQDFFLGGRTFGKLLQTFSAFGAGTGANDPVVVGRTTYTSGLSGIWGVLLWLFATPFYWIFGVWYRRMRHLTLGDWFVERYESKALGAAYALFGVAFYMLSLSVAFAAVGKVTTAMLGAETLHVAGLGTFDAFRFLLPIIAGVVALYGIAGGLRAAYWTDLIQGILIIALSCLLIPFGLAGLVEKYGDGRAAGLLDGFRLLHEQVADEYFEIIASPLGGEFPLYFIVAITLINVIGVVVQPHFIATGGGSARSETSARVGLVVGNFLKRLCTVGWALTALIALALLADEVSIAEDPDRMWGVATRRILGAEMLGIDLGLVGLMLACLLAALMSSADCFMLVGSALVVRNMYAAYLRPQAGERETVLVGRLASLAIIGGATALALYQPDVFTQLKNVWEFTIIFAAVFWVGMFWRGATTAAAWTTALFCLLMFFVLPPVLPYVWPALRTNPQYAKTNLLVTISHDRPATAADVGKRAAQRALWEKRRDALLRQGELGAPPGNAGVAPRRNGRPIEFDPAKVPSAAAIVAARLGPAPHPLVVGQTMTDTFRSGGRALFWSGGFANQEALQRREVLRVETRGEMVLAWRPAGERVETTRFDRSELAAGRAPADVVAAVNRFPQRGATIVIEEITGQGAGQGQFNLDLLLYDWLGIDLAAMNDPLLETLRFPHKIVTPFVLMIVVSLFTRRNSPAALDRYYVKMRTPVEPDPADDAAELQLSYDHPQRFAEKRLINFGGLEFQRPTRRDLVGVGVSFAVCFAIIALAVWLAQLGAK
jgi:SSS family solute:Na+ symporter